MNTLNLIDPAHSEQSSIEKISIAFYIEYILSIIGEI